MKEPIELLDINELILFSSKIDRRIGIIIEADNIDEKFIKLKVNFGENNFRTIVTNVGNELPKNYDLVGIKTFFIINMKPIKFKGIISEGIMVPVFNSKGNIEFGEFSIGDRLM